MIPVTLSKTGTGASRPYQADYWPVPFNLGFGCVITSGAATYSVQHTFDDIQNPAITPTWFNHATVVGVSANADGNYAFPVTAIRLYVTEGTGSVSLTIVQAGD
jgi:hypothetical protein